MAEMRLDKLLASTGKWSRKEVKRLIKEGRVLADGRPAASADEKYDPDTCKIQVDGLALSFSEYHYVMLHKPAGVLSATEDRTGETVLDLLPPELQRLELFPVGRLDKDTEGLLLMTDDGVLAHRLLSPKHHVDKMYYASVDGVLTEDDIAAFAEGISLGDFRCMPGRLEILHAGKQSEALVVIHEGKFHQVRRMMESRGKPVVYLKRLSMGPLELDPKLPKGCWRYLSQTEIDKLLALK